MSKLSHGQCNELSWKYQTHLCVIFYYLAFLPRIASARSRDNFYLPTSTQNSEVPEELVKAEEFCSICQKQSLLISEVEIEQKMGYQHMKFQGPTMHCFKDDVGTSPTKQKLPTSALGWVCLDARNTIFRVHKQQRRRPACACAQSDQHLCYSLIVKYT